MRQGRRLQPELVPRRLWGISAQELLRSAWRGRIRIQALTEAKNGRCTRCAASTGRIVHEEWEYDEEEGVATLVGLAPICEDCHAVAHVDQVPTEHRARAVQHLADVNGITLGEAQALVDDALTGWERGIWKPHTRGILKPWRVEIAEDLIARYPDLARLPERAAAKLRLDLPAGRSS